MYALAVNGSPRKEGNTELLLREVLTELNGAGWETELVKVGGTAIRGCIFSKMLKADAMILGSPTYFAAVAADLKALIERAGYVAYANNHAFSGKIGAAVVAVRRGGATHVYDTINHMFQMSRMIIPGSTYWNMGFGLAKGEALKDEEGLANMRHLGKCIDWLGKAIIPHMGKYPRS
jgi:multimeric flavodoxin WrbA